MKRVRLTKIFQDKVEKFIDLMIASGEWDKEKMSYLNQNWEGVYDTFRKIADSNGVLGSLYLFEKGKKVIGSVYTVRLSKDSFMLGCRGVLKEYDQESKITLEKELPKIIPKECKNIINFPRVYSKGPIDENMKKLGLRKTEDIYLRYASLPRTVKMSLEISSPFYYCEISLKKIKKRDLLESRLDKSVLNFLQENCPQSVLDIFDIGIVKDINFISSIFKNYGLYCKKCLSVFPERKNLSLGALISSASIGISASGYTDATFIIGKNTTHSSLKEFINMIASFYLHQQKKRAFVFIPMALAEKKDLEKLGLKFVKPLFLVSYPINRR